VFADDQVTIRVECLGHAAVVSVTGELDMASAPQLEEALGRLVGLPRRPPLDRVEVDLSGVPFADVVGLTPVLTARAVLHARGAELSVQGAEPQVVRLLRLLDVAEPAPGAAVGPAGLTVGTPDVA
jgi:anti-sigma B factor antagonist